MAGAKLAMRKPAYSGRMLSGSQRWLLLDDIRVFAVLSYKPPHRCEIRVLSLALGIVLLFCHLRAFQPAAYDWHSSANKVLIEMICVFYVRS